MHTEEELLLEYFEDLWESEPERALSMLGTFEDDIVLETGDAEIDEIERRLAAGEDPDEVLKGWGDGEGGKVALNDPLKELSEKQKEEKRADAETEEEFDDDYGSTAGLPDAGLSWSPKES